MASEAILAVRRVQAIEEQARQLADVNRKLDLIMNHLGIREGDEEVVEPTGSVLDADTDAGEAVSQEAVTGEAEDANDPKAEAKARAREAVREAKERKSANK